MEWGECGTDREGWAGRGGGSGDIVVVVGWIEGEGGSCGEAEGGEETGREGEGGIVGDCKGKEGGREREGEGETAPEERGRTGGRERGAEEEEGEGGTEEGKGEAVASLSFLVLPALLTLVCLCAKSATVLCLCKYLF